MIRKNIRQNPRHRRKRTIRKRVFGTPERPRMSVFRSANHIYVQVIDDTTGRTLVSDSTITSESRAKVGDLKKAAAAELVGEALARKCLQASIEKVVFDRNGFKYHGRIKALADGARKGGLDF